MEPENFIEDLTNFKLYIDEDSEQSQALFLLSWSKKISENTDVNQKFADSGCDTFNQLGLWINPAILEEEEQ